MITIRVGMEGGRRAVLAEAARLCAPILISANSLWNHERRVFSGWQCYLPHDTALDCGGFVAMRRYGGYRWTVPQYVALAKAMAPAWWSQMDFCCEPEIAGDRRTVRRRIDQTAGYLHECAAAARDLGAAKPMPVLQGWQPRDYCEGPIYSGYDWPDLVGIGSVCRRQVHGPDGLLAVINALDQRVPPHVRFHLFGVKSTAMAILAAQFSHRIQSVDSMAWNFSARKDAFKAGVRCDSAMRAAYMGRWYIRQTQQITQPQMQFSLPQP